MIKFPTFENVEEPPMRNMTPEEYLRFCEFCVKSNPHITPQSCMDRQSGEEEIKVPFRIC